MEDWTGEGLRRGATRDQIANSADRGVAMRSLDGQARTRVEPAPAPFEVRRVDHPLGVVLALGGELDLATVPLLQARLDLVVRGGGAVVIDLSGLRFIDSSGLSALVRAERQLRASGGQLALVYGSRAVRRAFELTRLDHYFAWCDSPNAALRTAHARRAGSRRKPTANGQTAAELDRELGGARRS
jgi:anti-sigma B factor antagonist